MDLVRFTRWQRVARAVFIVAALIFTVLPLSWLISIAIRPPSTAVFPITLLPPTVTLDNLREVLVGSNRLGFTPFINAAVYGTSSAAITMIASILGGYALARYNVRAGESILTVILALSFLPAVSRIVPIFILFSYSGLYGTQLGVILAYLQMLTSASSL